MRAVWELLWCGLLLVAIAAIVASLIPFHVLQARARSLSNSGQDSFFTCGFYHAMQWRLRAIAAGNLALVLALRGFRQRTLRFLERILVDSRKLAGDIRLAVKLIPAFDLFSLAGITLLAAFVRVPLLSQPMRYDEATTFLLYSSRPFYVALSFYNTPNNHLLHTLLVRLSYLVFGNYPWALRLPALLAGLCLVPASYIAARALYRGGGALLTAGLVASSSILAEYSTNARGYSMLCLLVLLLIPLADYALHHENWAAWTSLAILSALGFFTIPIMLYPFGGICLWLVLSAMASRLSFRILIPGLWLAMLLTAGITLELYSPVFAVSGPAAVFTNKWVVASPVGVVLRELPRSLESTWQEWNRGLPWWLTWILAAGFLASLLLHRRWGKSSVPLPLALLGCVFPLVLVQRVVPFPRVWLFALPLYFITATPALANLLEPLLERLRLRHGMALLALGASLFLAFGFQPQQVYATNEGRGCDSLTLYLKQHLEPGDSVVAALPSDVPMLYNFRKEGVQTSYLGASQPKRLLVVVNSVSGDTVQKVLSMANIPNSPGQEPKLLVQYDSASLYEVIPPPPDAVPTT
jgi:hypothetical protein